MGARAAQLQTDGVRGMGRPSGSLLIIGGIPSAEALGYFRVPLRGTGAGYTLEGATPELRNILYFIAPFRI